MKSRKFRDYLPLLILVLAQLYTLYLISTKSTVTVTVESAYVVERIYQVVDDDKFYIGVAAVIVCFAAMIINRRMGKWVTVATLLAGMLGLIAFTPNIIHDFKFNSIAIEFQAFPFWVLILFTILNFRSLKRYVKWLLQKESEPQA